MTPADLVVSLRALIDEWRSKADLYERKPDKDHYESGLLMARRADAYQLETLLSAYARAAGLVGTPE